MSQFIISILFCFLFFNKILLIEMMDVCVICNREVKVKQKLRITLNG